jgi:transmembrane sensor
MPSVPQEEGAAPQAVRRRVVLMTPAVALAVLLAGALGMRIYSEQSEWESLSTAIGDYRRLPLPDGSMLELNTASELRFRLSGKLREIELAAGEARFRVTHDAGRPFVVSAGNTVIRAVGTEFTVRIQETGKVDVIVAEGVVAVTHRVRDGVIRELLHGRQAPPLQGGAAVEERHRVTDDGGQFTVVEMTRRQIDAHDAWRNNMLLFEDVPLREIVAEFNRYNRTRLEIDDPSIVDVPIGGRYSPRDVEGFLENLGTVMSVRVAVGTLPTGQEVLRLYGGHSEADRMKSQ